MDDVLIYYSYYYSQPDGGLLCNIRSYTYRFIKRMVRRTDKDRMRQKSDIWIRNLLY